MKNRIIAIDIFRGMTIALMIVVNSPGTWGAIFDPFEHAAWNGCTPTDLVFPSFLFIIGCSAWFSFKTFDHRLTREALRKILRRTTVLFLLGLFLFQIPGLIASLFDASTGAYLHDTFRNLRILGVLQRLALCYGIGSVIVLYFQRPAQIAICSFLLLFYWWATAIGGNAPDPFALGSNAVLKLDTWLFGAAHLWHGEIVDGQPFAFDPEGLLSTLPAIVTFVIGYLTGGYIGRSTDKRLVTSELFPIALIMIAMGYLWSEVLGFPINKKLWTSSYVLYAGGWSLLGLTFCIWLSDIKGWARHLSFFRIYGTNPLLAYVLSELLVISLYQMPCSAPDGTPGNAYTAIYETVFVSIAGEGEWASLLFAVTFALLIWAMVYGFYRRGVFWKI